MITGDAGFIGSHLTHKLLSLGYRVAGVDNFNDYYNPKIKIKNIAEFKKNPRFKQYQLDILDEKLKQIFVKTKPEIIIHLAARAGVRPSLKNPKLYYQVNMIGTKKLLELAKKHHVKQFIFASSSSVYGNQEKIPFSESDKLKKPVSPYAETKLKGEALCQKYNFPTTVLRFFTVYGPNGRPDMAPYLFTQAILEGKTITRYGDGSTKRDYTYIDDIINGVVAAINHPRPFEIINLGNNYPVSLNNFIRLLEKIIGKKAIIQEKPRHPADVPQTFADIKKAKKLLNWQPETNLKTGLTKFVNWFKFSQPANHA